MENRCFTGQFQSNDYETFLQKQNYATEKRILRTAIDVFFSFVATALSHFFSGGSSGSVGVSKHDSL